MRIVTVAGARPNFIKIAPLMWEMQRQPEIRPFLVHTGQHYDVQMSGQFFSDLNIPPPDVSLEVGSGSHAYQTAEVMRKIEPVLEKVRPEVVVVVGDVNSTVAAALTAAKLHIPVAHVEAGLRSYDRTMPEEINRLVTDAVADYLFVSEESGIQNLRREGIAEQKIFFVGNVMIDSLNASRRAWERSTIHARLGVRRQKYGVVTLHRPSNVDNEETLRGIMGALGEVAKGLPLIFPVHPRTCKRLEMMDNILPSLWFGEANLPSRGVCCLKPINYLDFMALIAHARVVLTDSGGLQEETSALGVPCLTLRENTERPITVTQGTNQVVGVSPAKIIETALTVLTSSQQAPPLPPLWDGKAAERIVAILKERVNRPAETEQL